MTDVSLDPKSNEIKSLRDISWNVEESVYREDPALSYSILAKYERSGFNGLKTLFEPVTSASLTFGSAVDALITGGQKEFDSQFLVMDYPKTSETLVLIARTLFDIYHDTFRRLDDIPDTALAQVGKECDYYAGDKYEKYRIKCIREGCGGYYDILFKAQDKTVISEDTYKEVSDCVDALKTSNATKDYFADDNPFTPFIERLYQLKFKATLNEVDYRCMADELIVNHQEKWVLPIDLKTSHHTEWDFYKSFIDWNYQIQARLYWKIIRANMDKDSYFKDFKLLDYRFIVINKTTLTPLVWECSFTQMPDQIEVGKDKQIILRDPLVIGSELKEYLDKAPKVPVGIKEDKPNDLLGWLSTL